MILKGKNHYNWRGGKPRCQVCGKQLSTYKVERCRRHKIFTEQHRKNMGIAHKGQLTGTKNPMYGKGKFGKDNPMWDGGMPKCADCGIQLKDRRSKYCYRCVNKQSRCYNWKGGVTPVKKRIVYSQEWKEWRKKIFKRDNYTCQKCYSENCLLHPHHLNPFKFSRIINYLKNKYGTEKLYNIAIKYEPLWDPNNGITLCVDCHKKTTGYASKK